MKFEPSTASGQLLWRLLPQVYRRWDGRGTEDPRHPTRQDEKGDLAEYLDAVGTLFDRLRGSIEQRLLDTSPETCQSWLIPYFADLLDVRLVSPDIDGQREEVARAVAWRQRKGTLSCIAEVAQAVGRYERIVKARAGRDLGQLVAFPTVVIHEGYRRVATTVSLGRPLPSLRALGLEPTAYVPAPSPLQCALRPGLQPGTVDFRFLSRARVSSSVTPQVRQHAFGDEGVFWQQEHPRGAPCHPNTYQDSSVRTPDMRNPSHAHGHYHPRRVLLYAAPRDGFFSPGALDIAWSTLTAWFTLPPVGTEWPEWEERGDVRVRERVLSFAVLDGRDVVRIEREIATFDGSISHQVVAGLLVSDADVSSVSRRETVGSHTYELVSGFELLDAPLSGVSLPDGSPAQSRTLRGFGAKTPAIQLASTAHVSLAAFGAPLAVQVQSFEALVVRGPIEIAGAVVQFRRVAMQHVTIDLSVMTPGIAAASMRPAVSAVDSLFETVSVTGSAECRFEYCTVLGTLACERVDATDSILMDASSGSFSHLYLRYSAAPWLPATIPATQGRVFEVVRERPLFLETAFGRPGCAVLHPGAHFSIRNGAEDKGELGAYHREHHVLREKAVVDKLREFLPVSVTPALIPHAPFQRPIP